VYQHLVVTFASFRRILGYTSLNVDWVISSIVVLHTAPVAIDTLAVRYHHQLYRMKLFRSMHYIRLHLFVYRVVQ